MRQLRFFGFLLVIIVCALTITVVYFVRYQGVMNVRWENYKDASVQFDKVGIPTITAPDWPQLIKAQGFVHASERMWQMDLLRRLASGHLSAWFGEAAVEVDTRRLREDWHGAAMRAVADLPQDEKIYCDTYAEGVNQFIAENKGAWGLEYKLMGISPDPWGCVDSLLVILHMADVLTASVDMEAKHWRWRQKLSDEWQNFVFPKVHPWAKPLFGVETERSAPIPPSWQFLPSKALESEANIRKYKFNGDEALPGSNAWAWSDPVNTYLAGDPHLQQAVPQVWYANRLRISPEEWVVGVSLAGIPGVVIGMNPHLGWTFTNLGEDVDDYVEEKISPDKEEYLAFEEGGRPQWRRLAKKILRLEIKGQGDRNIEAWFSHRGPVVQNKILGPTYYSRQWLALRKGSLRLPTIKVNRAKTWSEFNAALDHMIAPAQCALYADRQGNLGYRATGVDIKRRHSGHVPLPMLEGEWIGVETPEKRRRLFKPASERGRNFLVNANAEIWVDQIVQRWAPDDRRARIDAILSEQKDPTQDFMENLQLDTQSRFSKELLGWIARRSTLIDPKAQEFVEKWQKWDGDIKTDESIFTQSQYAETLLQEILLARMTEHFYEGEQDFPPYEHFMRRAWLLRVISDDNGPAAFGLQPEELASHLMKRLCDKGKAAEKLVPHSITNAWMTQHPFVDRVPVVGRFFKIESFPQLGSMHAIRAERPKYGPSMRMVLNMKKPAESTWLFPVGQSGHLGSVHFRDQQHLWKDSAARFRVFADGNNWNL